MPEKRKAAVLSLTPTPPLTRKGIARRLAAVFCALFLSGCGFAPEYAADFSPSPLRIQSDNPDLRQAAADILLQAGAELSDAKSAWNLMLSERRDNAISSRTDSGIISAYDVRYYLRFRLSSPDGKIAGERELSANRNLDNNESRHLAGRIERDEVVAQLRRRLLAQMIFQLEPLATK